MRRDYPMVAMAQPVLSPDVVGSRSDSRRAGCQPRAHWLGVVPLWAMTLALLGGCERSLPTVDLAQTATTAPEVPEPASGPLLRVAVGPMMTPETTRVAYQDLLRLIANGMGARAVLLQRRTYQEILALLEAGEADIGFVSAGAYVEGHERSGLEPLAVPVVRGERVARAYLVVPAASAAQGLDGLARSRFALSDPLSAAGYLLPRHILVQRGDDLSSFFLETFFTRAQDASLRAVAHEQADGAAIHSWPYQWMLRDDPSLMSRVRVVGESEPFGMPPAVVPPDVDADQVQQLRALLLTLHDVPEARPLLDRLLIDRFDVADDADYDSVRRMLHAPDDDSED